MKEIHINTDGDDRWWLQQGAWEETSYGSTWKYDQKDEVAGLMDNQLIEALKKLGSKRKIKIDIHWGNKDMGDTEARKNYLKDLLTEAKIQFSS